MAFLGLLRRPRATDESKIVSDRRAGCSADGGHHARLVTIAARGAEPRASTAARPRAPSGTRPERAREMSTDSATVDRVVGLTAASRPRPEPQATRWCQHRAAISGRRYPSSAYRASRGGCPALPRTSERRVLCNAIAGTVTLTTQTRLYRADCGELGGGVGRPPRLPRGSLESSTRSRPVPSTESGPVAGKANRTAHRFGRPPTSAARGQRNHP
jgi:hypothetical protein